MRRQKPRSWYLVSSEMRYLLFVFWPLCKRAALSSSILLAVGVADGVTYEFEFYSCYLLEGSPCIFKTAGVGAGSLA